MANEGDALPAGAAQRVRLIEPRMACKTDRRHQHIGQAADEPTHSGLKPDSCHSRYLWYDGRRSGCRNHSHSILEQPVEDAHRTSRESHVTSPDQRIRIFDRELLRIRRDRHAATFSETDFLHRRAADDLLERLSFIRRDFPVAVDLGAATGALAQRLREAGIGRDRIISLDTSESLLSGSIGLRIVADEELLPIRSGSLDLVVSALSLQLVNDLPGTLLQIRRALKPDGLMLVSLLGGMTLHELREAFALAEAETTGGASPRVIPFADVRELGGLLQRADFALPVADSETLDVGYASALHLMRDLRALGWANPLVERSRRPLRRDTLRRVTEIYQERHARPDGKVRATFEIVTLTGWAPHGSQQKPLRPGSAKARLADALGTAERPAGEKPSGQTPKTD
jgi:SAM-dependent methyltransferase